MKTYEPMQGMVYRHLDREADPYAVPVMSTHKINQLPTGYANGSPRTYLGPKRHTSPAA